MKKLILFAILCFVANQAFAQCGPGGCRRGGYKGGYRAGAIRMGCGPSYMMFDDCMMNEQSQYQTAQDQNFGYTPPKTFAPTQNESAAVSPAQQLEKKQQNDLLPPPTLAPQPTTVAPTDAEIVVNIAANCQLYINGKLTKATGTKREFVAHNLQPGSGYKFNLVAVYEEWQKTKTVVVPAGQSISVTF
jgi:uncharacterized protein (TIGR03000 family)